MQTKTLASSGKAVVGKETIPCISSQSHPVVNRIRTLQDRKGRSETDFYVIEGLRHLVRAVKMKQEIEALYVSPETLTHEVGRRYIRQLRLSGVVCYHLSADLYRSLTLAAEPQGVIAIMKQKWEPLEKIRPSNGLCWIVVETVQSSGNLGTILRTAEAVGGAGVIFLGDSTDPFDPACVRASMGSIFSQRFVRTDIERFQRWRRGNPFTLVGTSPSATKDYHQISYPRPTFLMMGCERKGLSEELLGACDLTARIPMSPQADSLNVAIATGIMLYEIYNQRRSERK